MRGNQCPFSECDRICPLYCSVGGEASAREGRKPRCLLKAPRPRRSQGPDHNNQQGSLFFVCPFFVLYFQGSSCQHQQFQHSLTAAIWTLIRQQLPATTLKMRLLSLLLLAHRLLLMTITFKLCPPPAAAKASNHKKRKESNNCDAQKANRRSNGRFLPPPRSNRSALPSQIST